MKYLKGDSKGVRFFTSNTEPDHSHTIDGDLCYKEIGFTDSIEKAQALCQETEFLNNAAFIKNLVKQINGGQG